MMREPREHFIPYEKWEAFLEKEWPQHRQEHIVAAKKIDEMHSSIAAIREDTKHLTKLDLIASTLGDMRDSLIQVVSGKNIVDSETVKEMLKAQQSSHTATISTISKVFGVVIIVLVGLKFIVPHWFHN